MAIRSQPFASAVSSYFFVGVIGARQEGTAFDAGFARLSADEIEHFLAVLHAFFLISCAGRLQHLRIMAEDVKFRHHM